MGLKNVTTTTTKAWVGRDLKDNHTPPSAMGTLGFKFALSKGNRYIVFDIISVPSDQKALNVIAIISVT